MTDIGGAAARDPIEVLADRPSAEFDEVVLQADYAARATLSFYRFRQLGGGRLKPRKRRPNEPAENFETEDVEKLKLGGSRRYGVHYVSDHPEVRILQLSVIALLVLFESAANAYFFAQQSEFGLSGGLFQAAAVSLANVATSFFIIGFWGLRHASTPAESWSSPWDWDSRNYIKLFGIGAVIAGVVVVLLVNLSAAHYRNLIDMRALAAAGEADLDTLKLHTSAIPRFWISAETCETVLTSDMGQSIASAATNAMCRPFALHSLDAMVLFALGLAISALAAFEGRGADAAYPGLSDAARHLEKAREDLKYALEDYYDSIQDRIDEAKEIFKDQKETLDLRAELHLRDLLKRRVAPFETHLATTSDILSDEFGVDADIVAQIKREDR